MNFFHELSEVVKKSSAEVNLWPRTERRHSVTKFGDPYQNSYCWILRLVDDQVVKVTAYADTALIDAMLQPSPRGS